jgi:uncharacterized protein (TIGR03118 family)
VYDLICHGGNRSFESKLCREEEIMKMMPAKNFRLGAMTFAAAAVFLIGASSGALAAPAFLYKQTNLTSNQPHVALHIDPNLQNAWGVTFLPASVFPGGSPFWVSDNSSGLSTLYTATGMLAAPPVNIPSPSADTGGTPTGLVANLTLFTASPGFQGDIFIFDTEDGTIVGWTTVLPNFNTQAVVKVDNSPSGAVYKGLALASDSAGGEHLYATNFNSGNIDVFDSNDYAPNTVLSSKFKDPTPPRGYAPFGIELIGGNLWISYALQDAAKHDPVHGVGLGFVDIFTTDGDFVSRFASFGQLNAPWGMMVAPSNFGVLANQVLIGNFGDGRINAFTPAGVPLGQLVTQKGRVVTTLVIDGLWKLLNGKGAAGVPRDTVYFSAGPDKETNGLFGKLSPIAPK